MDREDKMFFGAAGVVGCLGVLWYLAIISAIVVGIILAWRNFG